MEDLVYYPMFVAAALAGQDPTAQNVNLYVHTQNNIMYYVWPTAMVYNLIMYHAFLNIIDLVYE